MEPASPPSPARERSVVVTGMGVVSSLGLEIETFWQNLAGGRFGFAPIRAFPTDELRTTLGAEVNDEALNDALAAVSIKPWDRAADMAAVAAAAALKNSGRCIDPGSEPEPVSVLVGTGAGCTQNLAQGYRGFFAEGRHGLRPTTVPRTMFNSIPSRLSLRFQLTGPNFAVVSACASSAAAVGMAARSIRDGYTDVALCGGTDAVFEAAAFTAWDNLRVMSRNPDPTTACRPFDRKRDGLLLGEGAGFLVLETENNAMKRGAHIFGRILGYGESSDATHITRPDAAGQARAIKLALASAGLQPRDIDFVNCHGTGTPASDASESEALRRVFGTRIESMPPATSNKAQIGHLLGASGAVETIATLLTLRDGKATPNPTLEYPDPNCAINLVGRQATSLNASRALSNSFGFGGHNAVLVLGN